LSNSRARLQAIFGPQASLELHPRKQGGYVARVLIPLPTAAPSASKPELEATL